MEIHEAVADFSEDLVLEYLRQRSEAVGIPCEYTAGDGEDDSRYDYSSDEETERIGDNDQEQTVITAYTLKEDEHEMFSVRVKDRAKSIDSGVCVETRKENGCGKKAVENEGQDTEKYGSGNNVHLVHKNDVISCYNAVAGCSNGASHSLDHEESNVNMSLVLAFKKGDMFAVVVQDNAIWWGVMALRTAAVGYVPTSYLKFVEERHLWLTISGQKSSREVHMRALSDLQAATSRLPHPVVYGAMIPEPDYSDDERETTKPSITSIVTRNNQVNCINSNNKEQDKLQSSQGRIDERGLIMPKKLVNPYLESSDKKNLHRELMFNQKRGVNILNQKTELQKAMEKHNDKKIFKEQEKEKQASMTPFQKALDERAQKIEQMEKAENKSTEDEKTPSCEFEKIHAKVRAKMEVQ
ncbi:uncharacterized protein [Cherax quadricarinatus]|uniref:uncharacterized protein isoform X2 n=1 Tax=Cherax quadricarinatus TaxID=27406 RepID=UPI0023782F00|nr:uncharacterized protein LOC128692958 isoform X2 [Cherax quadricarinatus]